MHGKALANLLRGALFCFVFTIIRELYTYGERNTLHDVGKICTIPLIIVLQVSICTGVFLQVRKRSVSINSTYILARVVSRSFLTAFLAACFNVWQIKRESKMFMFQMCTVHILNTLVKDG